MFYKACLLLKRTVKFHKVYNIYLINNNMDLHIMDLLRAPEYEPVKPTYAIRIHCSTSPDPEFVLKKSQFYRKISEYSFDDNEPLFQAGPVTITEDIADSIVRDFAKHKDNVEALLVHCTRGRNRSPAVAIALNEVFSLGDNSNELKKEFHAYNKHVYKLVFEAGQRYHFMV